MDLQRGKSLIAWILWSPKKFSKPSQSDCLIFDREGFDALDEVIPNGISKSILHTRREIVYLNPKSIALLVNYLRLGMRADMAYCAAQIRQISPKVVLTFIDNHPAFHKLSNTFPLIRFIAIQNGNRFPYTEGCLPPEHNYQSEILLWSDYERDLYAASGTTFKQVYVTGSLRNQLASNHMDHSFLNDQSRYDICFISTYDSSARDSLWVIEGQVIGHWLNDFLKSDGSLKACVALRSASDAGINLETEIEHFQKIFGDRVTLMSRETPYSSYTLSDISSVTVSAGSSLSLEALARGNRSIVAHPLRTIENSLGSECPLRTYSTSKGSFTNLLQILLNASDEEFAAKYSQEIAYFSQKMHSSNVQNTLNNILWNAMETSPVINDNN